MKLRAFVACGVAAAAVLVGVGWWFVRSVQTVEIHEACADRELAAAAEEALKDLSASVEDYEASVAELKRSTAQMRARSQSIREKIFQRESDKFRSERVRKWLRR